MNVCHFLYMTWTFYFLKNSKEGISQLLDTPSFVVYILII